MHEGKSKGGICPGFNDSSWEPAQAVEGPGGKLQKTFFPPVKVVKEISPLEVYASGPGVHVVDMGVNFSGKYQDQT